MTKGRIHIYCGDGKGKTTAALGAALRAAGNELPVTIARFLKNDSSGEIKSLSLLPGVRVLPCTRTFGFSWTLNEEEKKEAAAYYTEQLELAFQEAEDRVKTQSGDNGPLGLLVLDEAIGACRLGFIPEDRLLACLKGRSEGLEVILTGRSPSEALCSQADYITEMKAVRHPYENGLGARKGIEY